MFQDGEPKTRQILSLSLKILESASIVGDTGSIPGSGRSPGGGNGNPVQYSCLENPMDIGAWWATVHGVTELDMSEQLMHACTCRWIWGRAVKIYARFRGAMNVWCFSSKWHMSNGAGLWHQNRSLLSIDKDQEGWEKTFLGMSLKDTETWKTYQQYLAFTEFSHASSSFVYVILLILPTQKTILWDYSHLQVRQVRPWGGKYALG